MANHNDTWRVHQLELRNSRPNDIAPPSQLMLPSTINWPQGGRGPTSIGGQIYGVGLFGAAHAIASAFEEKHCAPKIALH
jgi:hypothetical protein